MERIRKRLELGFAVLQTLDYCREVTGSDDLGLKVERAIIEKELADTLLCTQIDAADQEIARISLGAESHTDHGLRWSAPPQS
jgi:hypothetical protein